MKTKSTTKAKLKPKPKSKPKMKWKKSDPEIVGRFEASLPDHAAVARKKMFGYSCAFVNGYFFAGMFQDDIVIRLPDGLRETFPALARSEVFDPMGTGKGMKDWWTIPAPVTKSGAKLAALLLDAFEKVRKLPPKPPKKRKA